MKKTIIALAIVVALAFIFGAIAELQEQRAESNAYALATKVVNVDHEKDLVTCTDYNGNLWEFYGAEDWQEGDCANLLMNDNGTAEIYDDIIENVRYSAWELN